MEETKTVTLPGWETVRCIGSGSSGTVYELRKRDEYGGDLRSALKVISIPSSRAEYEEMRSSMSEYAMRAKLRERVEEISGEYRMMGVLKGHPNVVSCEDTMIVPHTDDLGWDIYIRMELLKSLPEYVHENGITGSEVMKLGCDICSALEACRENGIIHRDIKPQNIFVSRYGDFKLGDFGVAKMVNAGTLNKVGTYSYMAPEVFKGLPYNASVDIYSLGMVLYWLLNERRGPFLPLPPQVPTNDETADAQLRRYRGDRIPEPKNGNPAMKKLIVKACSYKVESRFSTPAEMKQAIMLAMSGRTAPAPVSGEDEPTVREEFPKRPAPVKKPAEPSQPSTAPTPAKSPQPAQKPKPQPQPVKKPPEPVKKQKEGLPTGAVILTILLAILIIGVIIVFAGGKELFDFDSHAKPSEAPVIESAEPTFALKSVIVSSPSISLKEGETEWLGISFIPELPAGEDVQLIWKSSDSGIAAVDGDGNVQGISEGTATVRVYVADDPDIYDECVVTVIRPVITELSIEQLPEKIRYSFGDTLDLTGLTLRAHYDNDTVKRITDPNEYTVSGNLNGLGSRTITVTYDGMTAEFTVWVGLF